MTRIERYFTDSAKKHLGELQSVYEGIIHNPREDMCSVFTEIMHFYFLEPHDAKRLMDKYHKLLLAPEESVTATEIGIHEAYFALMYALSEKNAKQKFFETLKKDLKENKYFYEHNEFMLETVKKAIKTLSNAEFLKTLVPESS